MTIEIREGRDVGFEKGHTYVPAEVLHKLLPGISKTAAICRRHQGAHPGSAHSPVQQCAFFFL